MLSGCSNSAICVQNFNDSLSCAIRITYRSSQRSSSIYEPRDPPLKVVGFLFSTGHEACGKVLLVWIVVFEVVKKEGTGFTRNPNLS